ncbi:MAG TPA: hypothetical protein VF192_09240 [Longimicrobiales bacterium]
MRGTHGRKRSGARRGELSAPLWLLVVLASCAAGADADPGANADAGPRADAAAPAPQGRWWKGNLHTHSFWSDGDDYPEMIVDWYRNAGYHFLAISDHNVLPEGERWVTVPPGGKAARAYARYLERFGRDWVVAERLGGDTLRVRLKTLAEYRPLFEEPGRFLLIQSEEISDRFEDKPLHVNATNIAEAIEPQGGNSVREVLQNNIDAVLAQRERTHQPMFPHVNHPNFVWAVTVEDLMALEGERFFEVYNGHPLVHNDGDDVHPSTERMWDILLAHRLAEGREIMFGLATDDAHHYHGIDVKNANPGRGWVMVRAPELTADALIAALERGDFYATSGVLLRDVRREGDRITIEIEAEEGVSYRTTFIGTRRGYDARSEPRRDAAGRVVSRGYSDDIGEVLAEVEGPVAEYRLRGDELYVRARIVSSRLKQNGYRPGEYERAWTQPFVVR